MARNRLYIGNLPYKTCTEDAIRELLAPRTPTEIKIINDRETGRPRGFAFVSFATDIEALETIEHFNGMTIDGRDIIVNEAREPQRGSGSGGGPRGGGGRNTRRDAGSGGQRERSDDSRGDDYDRAWKR